MIKILLMLLMLVTSIFSYDLYIHEAGGVNREKGLISTGFPFKAGEVADVSNLTITSNGNPIEA